MAYAWVDVSRCIMTDTGQLTHLRRLACRLTSSITSTAASRSESVELMVSSVLVWPNQPPTSTRQTHRRSITATRVVVLVLRHRGWASRVSSPSYLVRAVHTWILSSRLLTPAGREERRRSRSIMRLCTARHVAQAQEGWTGGEGG